MGNSEEEYKYEPHNYAGKICHWLYCVKCGSIRLNNPFSHWADKKGCLWYYHPGMKAERAKTGINYRKR